MSLRLHNPDYDELQGLIVKNEQKGYGVVEKTSKFITQIYPDEIKTAYDSDFDIILDFSYLNDIEKKTIMRKS
ncbi:hypothetical protein B6U98_03805 [Thermoplasmatales archaeon ex4572_165]|nr:MAG: hypothetical protein B6U98_03805 [Thermoplasmatales archaeon ex4572_165]RLF59759.1 MAG: hypothetical protein DRN27_01620 [Thermoplasmata archaeon]